MGKLSEWTHRIITTDGQFVYNCGYVRSFDPRTAPASSKPYDVSLIGVIGGKHTVEIPTHFNGRRIKEVHHFTIYEKTDAARFPADAPSFLPSVFCPDLRNLANWQAPENELPSPSVLTPSRNACCDSVTVLNTVLGTEAFQKARIRTVKLSTRSVKLPARAFFDCAELSHVELVTSYTEIGSECFAFCRRLKQIALPDSVTTIKQSAFAHCGLTSVILPESVRQIQESAFFGCTELKAVAIPKTVESIAASAFSVCPQVHIISAVGSYGEEYASKNHLPFLPYEYVLTEILKDRSQYPV